MNANLLACASHHRLWLEKFPLKLAPTAKVQAVGSLACNSFKLSDDVIESKTTRSVSIGTPHFDNMT